MASAAHTILSSIGKPLQLCGQCGTRIGFVTKNLGVASLPNHFPKFGLDGLFSRATSSQQPSNPQPPNIQPPNPRSQNPQPPSPQPPNPQPLSPQPPSPQPPGPQPPNPHTPSPQTPRQPPARRPPPVMHPSVLRTRRQKLVILGSGWSSYSLLRNVDKSLYDVFVVSPRNHFLFTPLLASTTVGTLEFRSIVEPIRNVGFRRAEHFHLSKALSLDLQEKSLECESFLRPGHKYKVDYDKLVIGVGALSNTFNVPGVKEHAFFLKEVVHARQIRNRILSNLELSIQPGISEEESDRLLHTVIVGGGPAGVEFGAELYDFVEQDCSRLYKHKHPRVTLVESNQILGSFDVRLRKYAEKKIRQRERFDLLQSRVTEVKEDGVSLADGSFMPCGLVVWSTGLAPRRFIKDMTTPKNNVGQILTDSCLRLIGDDTGSVYAFGDCADIKDYPLPCTAQVAERQGRYLSKIMNENDHQSALPFEFESAGALAYIGRNDGLSDLPDVKLRGFPSWIIWRSAYLTRLGSWRLRMQVPMDWLKSFLYGRDTSKFE